ncbi:ABC1 transporter [Lotmaria passim]
MKSIFRFKRTTYTPPPSVASSTASDHKKSPHDRGVSDFTEDSDDIDSNASESRSLTPSCAVLQSEAFAETSSSFDFDSYSIFASPSSAAAAAHAVKEGFNDSRRPATPTWQGTMLALLERSMRQLYRRKLDFLIEVLVPLVFVAISIVLWAIWGSSRGSEEYYNNYVEGEKFGTQVIPGNFSDTEAMCFITLDGSKHAPVSTFHQCIGNTGGEKFSCNADMTYIPLLNIVLCIFKKYDWTSLTIYSIRRYLGYLTELPTLDLIIKLQWIALAAGEPVRQYAAAALGGITRNTRYSSVLSSGDLYFTGPPDGTARLIEFLGNMSALFPYVNNGVVYDSVDSAIKAAKGHRLWAIVELRQMDALGLDLVLHMNNSALPNFATRYNPTYSGGTEYDSVELYVVSGFLTLQKLISDFYLYRYSLVNVSQPFFLGSFPNPSFTRVPLLVNARQAVPLIFAMAFLYSVSQQTKRIVLEKELRIRESMLIMGMKNWAVYVCEFLTQLPVNVLTCALIAIMLKLTYVTKSDPLVLFLVFFLFSLTTIPLAGVIAAFFSHAHLASLVSPVVYVILVIPMFAMTNANGGSIIGVSILSPSGFSAALDVFLAYESGSGCGGKEINNSRDNPTMAVILGMLTADFFIYYLLMLYLDAVVPKEWGTPKHPLFFILDPIRWWRGTKHKRLEGGPDGRAENGVFETTDYTNDVVSFDGLRKEYSRGGKKFVAVNNLYWGMKEGEISVLLGHNGAGKTTVLNMLTGMTEPDEGDCYVYGHSVRMEKNAARQEIGYCPQHNILWSELTCRDHLEFYGKIKGLKGWELEDAICRMLFETDMLDKIDQPAGSLSGGMKRKLSIAISFVGGSRLVFLDEPTAGLDVGARRQVWELLKRMAQSRTILLTTHYMDEADLLGSRIGIMSQGRLKCTGSSLFLKSRLGVGYNLDISVRPNVDRDSIDEMVVAYVDGATVMGHNGCELSYQLPSRSVDQFPALLNYIDSKDTVGIRGYSLAATTLEEVFLKVSEEDLDCRRATVTSEELRLVWDFERATSVLWLQFKGMLLKRFWNALRDRRMQFFQILCPVVCVLVAMLLNLVNYAEERSLSYTFDMFEREAASDFLMTKCESRLGTKPTASHVNIKNMTVFLPNATYVERFALDTWFFHDAPRYGALMCDNVFGENTSLKSKPNVYAMYNTSSLHQAPLNFALYYDLLAKNLRGSWVHMNYSATLFKKAKAPTQFTTVFIGALIMIPFTFLPSNPVAWIVKERQCGSHHLQNLCGLNFFVYWGANFLFDMVAYFITMLLCITIFAIFSRKEFIGNDRVGGTFVLFIVYGFTSTVFGYCLSFLFNEYSTAQTVVMITSFAVGFVLLMFVYVLSLNESTTSLCDKMRWGFRVVPSYCIGEGIINLLQFGMRQQLGETKSVWDMDQLGWSFVYMAAEFPVFVIITLLAGHPWFGRVVQRMQYHSDQSVADYVVEDSDVEDERCAVLAAEQAQVTPMDDVVRVVNLQKQYSNGYVAVKGITFSIFPGEIFGFLGTNGAGKTTTISMLCQEFLPTGGRAYVCGHDVVSDSAAALACVGYCPQFDATLDLLTVEEQLELYAGIRGIAREEWGDLVDALCTLCELTMYRKTVTCELSGGNRRKLSVAMSLIGGPSVVFLDEPSAGMDPVARRGMWTAIQRAAKYCSVVLTTHHLEEVEALAETVAIMVKGSVQCFGDKVHLKNKFGSAFELSVLVSSSFHGGLLERFVVLEFPGAVCNESDGRRFVYQLPRDRPLGEIFRALQANRKALHITDYSVSQTSLEQIFLQVEKRAKARKLLESRLPSSGADDS